MSCSQVTRKHRPKQHLRIVVVPEAFGKGVVVNLELRYLDKGKEMVVECISALGLACPGRRTLGTLTSVFW